MWQSIIINNIISILYIDCINFRVIVFLLLFVIIIIILGILWLNCVHQRVFGVVYSLIFWHWSNNRQLQIQNVYNKPASKFLMALPHLLPSLPSQQGFFEQGCKIPAHRFCLFGVAPTRVQRACYARVGATPKKTACKDRLPHTRTRSSL